MHIFAQNGFTEVGFHSQALFLPNGKRVIGFFGGTNRDGRFRIRTIFEKEEDLEPLQSIVKK
jgi:hypothetical protein